jgi:hypothetical protein
MGETSGRLSSKEGGVASWTPLVWRSAKPTALRLTVCFFSRESERAVLRAKFYNSL